MIKEENFPNAYKEVYTILKYVSKEDYKAIPEDFLNVVKAKMNNDYVFNFNPNVELEEQKLLRETKVILGYIFLNYWGNEQQKKVIEEVLKNDLNKEETKKYDNDLFKDKQKVKVSPGEEFRMVIYKKEKFLVKLIKKFKYFFKRKYK